MATLRDLNTIDSNGTYTRNMMRTCSIVVKKLMSTAITAQIGMTRMRTTSRIKNCGKTTMNNNTYLESFNFFSIDFS